ncbi:hypothetical protein V8Z80_14275 [Orrella sp. JC864]|uniref:hypothetical protein n=1 Tax=Orrella sp. JC864 TaxID=3120298 RepID=UPI003008AAFD
MFTTQYSSVYGSYLPPASLGPRRKWPFQSARPAQRPASGAEDVASQQRRPAAPAGAVDCAGSGAQAAKPGLRAMVVDVALVLAWGAMIPGLMWLGHAGGF